MAILTKKKLCSVIYWSFLENKIFTFAFSIWKIVNISHSLNYTYCRLNSSTALEHLTPYFTQQAKTQLVYSSYPAWLNIYKFIVLRTFLFCLNKSKIHLWCTTWLYSYVEQRFCIGSLINWAILSDMVNLVVIRDTMYKSLVECRG